ncbi:hypothetical protein D3C78_591460 [compost metagenome]
MGAELLGQGTGALQGSVGHHDTPYALFMQVPRDQRNGFTSANQQCLTTAQITEDLLGQTDGGKGHRHRVFADGGVGTHLLGGAEGCLEQTPQQRPNGPGFARYGIGRLHLTEDLRLAQHQRVKPGGDAHHVPHGVMIFMDVGTGAQLIEAQLMVLSQPAQNTLCRQVILLYIQFTAVAGRKDRSFAAGGQSAELLQGFHQLLRGKRHALAYVYRGSLMVDTEGKKGHARSLIMTRSR